MLNPLTPGVKSWVIQSFLTFDSMDRTLKCDHSLESCRAALYCGTVVFVFQFYPVCSFGKFINFALGTVRSERVNTRIASNETRISLNGGTGGRTDTSWHLQLF